MYFSKCTTFMYLVSTMVILTVGVIGLPLNEDDANSTTFMPLSTEDATNSSESTAIVSIVTVTSFDNSSTSMQTVTSDITNTSDITAPITFISSESTSNSTSINTSPATVGPLATTQASTSGFDGASFGGGIALGAGLLLITFIAYRCYVIRANGQQKYNAM